MSTRRPEQPDGGPLPAARDRGQLIDPGPAVGVPVREVAGNLPLSSGPLWDEVIVFRGLSRQAEEELGQANPLAMFLLGAYSGLLDATGIKGTLTARELRTLLDDVRIRLRYANEGHPFPDSNGFPNTDYYLGRLMGGLFAAGEVEAIPTTEVPSVTKYLR